MIDKSTDIIQDGFRSLLHVPPDKKLSVGVWADQSLPDSNRYLEQVKHLLSTHGAEAVDLEFTASQMVSKSCWVIAPVSVERLEEIVALLPPVHPSDYGQFRGVIHISITRPEYNSERIQRLVRKLSLYGFHVAHPEFDLGEPLYCDPVKIVDLVLCKTKHTRYASKCLRKTVDPALLERHYCEFLASIHEIFAEGLFNSLTDGCISTRASDGSILVSATRTRKEPGGIGPDRVVQIVGWDLSRNSLEWCGSNAPSSSSPWHLRLYEWMPDIHAIVHTHTRNVTYSSHTIAKQVRSVPYARYGLPTVVDGVRHILGESPVAILRGHGEVAIGRTLGEATQNAVNLKRRVGGTDES